MSLDDREQSLYLQVLRDTAEALASSTGPQSTLERTVEIVARRLDFDVCSLYLLDRSIGELFLAATYGLAPESVGRVRMALGVGLTGCVAKTERPVFVGEAQKDPHFKFFPETGEERFLSFGGVPLLRHGELVGVLTVQTESVHTFHSNDIVLLQAVANQVAGIIDLSRLLAAQKRAATPSAPDCLLGLGTSAGIARGRAVVLGQASMLLPPPSEPFQGVEAELGRIERAFRKAIQAAEKKAERFRAAESNEAAAILGAHAFILRDPGLRARIEDRVTGGGASAARAVDETFRETIRAFEARDSRGLREKVHDLLDVRMQILSKLGVAVGVDVAEDEPYVVMAEFLTPAQTADLDPERVIAIVTEHGSETSHSSILARSRGIPAVVAVPDLLQRVRRGDVLLVDGTGGFVFVNPDEATVRQYEGRKRSEQVAAQRIADELRGLGGGRPSAEGYRLHVNLDFRSQIPAALESGARSVGLLRTEFYYMSRSAWPSRDDLEEYFRAVIDAFPGEVTVRLLDVGGEKRLPYVNWQSEPNPILGFRSIRFLLEHTAVYRTQVEALLAAAGSRADRVRVMVPMITAPWEMRAAREIFAEAAAEVGGAAVPSFGMMIEVPSVLFELDHYVPVADFFSVGTNDLVQYFLAVDRDNEQVKNYYNPFQPAVLRALRSIAEQLRPTGRPVSICGEMAGRPLSALALLALGFTEFSLNPRALPAIGALTFSVDAPFLDALREELLRLPTDEQVLWELRNALRQVAPFLMGS